MDTAFIAEYGSGNPVIGILGEYDALSGLSQSITLEKSPIKEGEPGHGCGHNLLGVAGVFAAVAIKNVMAEENVQGTIRYYGAPAEEELYGKVVMAKDGYFDDLDACVTWHPMNSTNVVCQFASLNSIKYKFKGITAHAGAYPEAGRSAHDAVELMNIGANYLREHVIDAARIHYAITETGKAPNIVPDNAEVWYMIRAPFRDQVKEITERIDNIAQGAALMSGTTFTKEFLVGCHDFLPNDTLGKVIEENMNELGSIPFADEDFKLATDLRNTVLVETQKKAMDAMYMPKGLFTTDLLDSPVKQYNYGQVLKGSSDVGEPSYIVPTVQFTTTCWPTGVPAHTWQSTLASGSNIGFKGTVYAARVLASGVIDMMTKPELIEAAKKEFNEKTNNKAYESPLA